MWYAIVAVLLVALTILFKKVILPSRIKQKQHKKLVTSFASDELAPKAQRVVAFLNKGISKICLEEDGKIYGLAFKNKQAPPLPHDPNCQCRHLEVKMRLSNIFEDNKQPAESFTTDLGELDFYCYKYYKYSLFALRHSDTPAAKDYQELRDNLIVDDDFKKQVTEHLASQE